MPHTAPTMIMKSFENVFAAHLTVPPPREGSVSPQSQKRSMSGTPSGWEKFQNDKYCTNTNVNEKYSLRNINHIRSLSNIRPTCLGGYANGNKGKSHWFLFEIL